MFDAGKLQIPIGQAIILPLLLIGLLGSSPLSAQQRAETSGNQSLLRSSLVETPSQTIIRDPRRSNYRNWAKRWPRELLVRLPIGLST